MKKKKIIIASLIILSIAIGSGFKYYFRSASAPSDAIWVEASKVNESTLPLEVTAIGTLVARSVEITPAIAGHVEKVFFQDGTFAKQGTVLIQLDDAIYKAKYASAKAKLAYSENNFKRMTLLG